MNSKAPKYMTPGPTLRPPFSCRRTFLTAVQTLLCCLVGATACGTESTTPESSSPDAGNKEDSGTEWACLVDEESENPPDFLSALGCRGDFLALASQPLNASIPGARSVKTSIDRDAGGELFFQNSEKFPIHWEFVSEHRSVADGLPRVLSLGEFNQTEYYSPSRRFILGALTHYEGPDEWVYEISPYDSASEEMIREAVEKLREHTYLGDQVKFHPTSISVTEVVEAWPKSDIVTTKKLFEGIDYQPLNPAESYGMLRFVTAAALAEEYVTYRDIVVLDNVPNDISVTQGIITAAFQTPLAHINVLSQNRGTPNMALRGAFDNEDLRALEGKWVKLRVGLSDYSIEEVDQTEADEWWEENKPGEVMVPGVDLEATTLRDIDEVIEADPEDLKAAIKAGTRGFGGKAANYAALARVPDVPVPKAFAVPVHFYMQFMEENGFNERVQGFLDDPEFASDAELRDARLAELRDDMRQAPVNAEFMDALLNKINDEYPNTRMRFRSSTNAEDLDGFTGAGLYTSKSGDPNDPAYPVEDAVRTVWSSVWFFRAFEERSYRSIDHLAVGMALLVHRSFPDEAANGVALTGNPFDKSGAEPAFYVNVQLGESSVVMPPPGITTDSFLYFFDQPGQDVKYLSQSNLIPADTTVLDHGQVQSLGKALDQIRKYFAKAYQQSPWWAMDVEFKFDAEEEGATPTLWVKQARPFGNR